MFIFFVVSLQKKILLSTFLSSSSKHPKWSESYKLLKEEIIASFFLIIIWLNKFYVFVPPFYTLFCFLFPLLPIFAAKNVSWLLIFYYARFCFSTRFFTFLIWRKETNKIFDISSFIVVFFSLFLSTFLNNLKNLRKYSW